MARKPPFGNNDKWNFGIPNEPPEEIPFAENPEGNPYHRGRAYRYRPRAFESFTPEEMELWEEFDPDVIEQELSAGGKIYVNSSMIDWVSFDIDNAVMFARFRDQPRKTKTWIGGMDEVSPLTLAEARDFLRDLSKGGWYWDHVIRSGKNVTHVIKTH